MQNFPTTTAIRKVWRCYHSKYYMDASAKLLCFGMNLEKIKSLGQKYFKKQKDKFKLLERTYN
jgi:hypothetical protein